MKNQSPEELREVLFKIEQSVKLPLGLAHSPFRIDDLILILREMSEIVSKEEPDGLKSELVKHEST